MKGFLLYFVAIAFCILFQTKHLFAQSPVCGFKWMLEQQAATDSSVFQRFASVNEALGRPEQGQLGFRGETVIPVVVHVVWQYPTGNISDEAILGQIESLNRDFNGGNTDLENVPYEFKPLVSSGGISFCLATTDPNGLPTSGILRKKTGIEKIGIKDALYYSFQGGSSAWDTERYLNIWVADTGEFISGFGSYPVQVEPDRQGVVVHPRFFGRNPFYEIGLGRTLVHEVGHFLGLNHVWDGNTDCGNDDGVPDTPLQQHPYTGCPVHPQISCGSMDLFMNFMDYVDDDCMVMFTEGQMDRMLTTLGTFRPKLMAATSMCQQNGNVLGKGFRFYPNPATHTLTLYSLRNDGNLKTIRIMNGMGQLVFQEKRILLGKVAIDITKLIPGLYWIEIDGDGKKLVVK